MLVRDDGRITALVPSAMGPQETVLPARRGWTERIDVLPARTEWLGPGLI
jgi:hypothetical protein